MRACFRAVSTRLVSISGAIAHPNREPHSPETLVVRARICAHYREESSILSIMAPHGFVQDSLDFFGETVSTSHEAEYGMSNE
jgi:hypothetical protein